MTEIVADIKYLRISPKKLREVADLVRKLKLSEALTQLKFLNKSGAKPLLLALKSAIANAKDKFKLEEKNLKIKTLEINEGPKFKRFRPVARGSAHHYVKRISHARVVLEEVNSGTES